MQRDALENTTNHPEPTSTPRPPGEGVIHAQSYQWGQIVCQPQQGIPCFPPVTSWLVQYTLQFCVKLVDIVGRKIGIIIHPTIKKNTEKYKHYHYPQEN